MITPYSNIISVTTLALLLDQYPSAAAAYSLRKLRSAYTGSAIRVRRASDNTEQDIGFVDNVLDTSSLTSFCSGTNGFVKTWYDQSGNGRDATQTTAANQPQIVSSGTVINDGVKNALRWKDAGTDNLSFSRLTNIRSVFYIAKLTDTGYNFAFFFGDSTNYDYSSGWQTLPQTWTGSNTLAAVRNGANRINAVNKNFDLTPRDLNRNLISMIHISSTGVASRISNDRSLTGRSWRGFISEIIIYADDQSSNRTGIETNINDFYSIY